MLVPLTMSASCADTILQLALSWKICQHFAVDETKLNFTFNIADPGDGTCALPQVAVFLLNTSVSCPSILPFGYSAAMGFQKFAQTKLVTATCQGEFFESGTWKLAQVPKHPLCA
jgi:hypothetical protein